MQITLTFRALFCVLKCPRYWDCLMINPLALLMPMRSPCEQYVWEVSSFLSSITTNPRASVCFSSFLLVATLFCPTRCSFPEDFCGMCPPKQCHKASFPLIVLPLITTGRLTGNNSHSSHHLSATLLSVFIHYLIWTSQ